jgi:hypothetical protein
MARHDARPVLSLEEVCKEYFAPLTLAVMIKKLAKGDIALPVMRSEDSQKASRTVHLNDLAVFIDGQREKALKEMRQLQS